MYIRTRTTSVGGHRIAPLSSPHKVAITTANKCSRHLLSRTECLPRGCIAREVGWTLPVTSLRRFTRDINAIATATSCERLRDRDFPLYLSIALILLPRSRCYSSYISYPYTRRTADRAHRPPRPRRTPIPFSQPAIRPRAFHFAHSRFPRVR